jgi:hypothetical protein
VRLCVYYRVYHASVVYLVVFAVFAYELRVVSDGFHIKTELKMLGICCVGAVAPWFIFNNIEPLKTYNKVCDYFSIAH